MNYVYSILKPGGVFFGINHNKDITPEDYAALEKYGWHFNKNSYAPLERLSFTISNRDEADKSKGVECFDYCYPTALLREIFETAGFKNVEFFNLIMKEDASEEFK